MPKFFTLLPLVIFTGVFSVGNSLAAEPRGGESAEAWEGDSSFYRAYSGAVGESVKIRLFLNRVGRDLDGYYYNLGDRMPIAVHGEIQSDGSVELTEFPFGSSDQSDTTFGRFTGVLSADRSEMSGRWKSSQGDRELKFYFREDYGGGVLKATLCRMSSSWDTRRGDKVISRERNATFVQFEGGSPGVNRVNAAIRAMVDGAFHQMDSRRVTDLGNIGDRVTSATAPTLEELHRGMEVKPPTLDKKDYAETDIESYSFAVIPVLNEVGLVCLRCYWDEYTGGAHPNYWDKYLTFDFLTGTRLSEGEIFKIGHSKPVAELGADALRKSWGLKPGAPLNDGATFEAGLALNQNWFVHPGGIGYSYNPYEVGPYSAGFIRFALPWSEVREWIQPGSPVLRATMTPLPGAVGSNGRQ